MPRTSLTLSLPDAQQMIRAALSAADALGLPYCVAVVDAEAHLLAFARQDGALIGCVDLAIGKARTSSLFEKSTEDLNRWAQPGADLYGIQHSNGGSVVLIGGGLPIVYEGAVIGAVGASAGTVAQDIAVSEAARAAVA